MYHIQKLKKYNLITKRLQFIFSNPQKVNTGVFKSIESGFIFHFFNPQKINTEVFDLLSQNSFFIFEFKTSVTKGRGA